MGFFSRIPFLSFRLLMALTGLQCLLSQALFAQDPPTSVEIPAVVAPSPDVSSLGKYGNTPVGLVSGLPDISIPLYTVQSRRIQVPITLSYHAGGNKVNEVSSWVGFGWSLNAGGVITRSVVGECDQGGFWSKTIKSASQIGLNDFYYCLSLARGSDGESDYYFYNFAGRSGKFVYTRNNNATPYLIPQSPIVINNAGDLFEVRDEMGNLYLFHDFETTQVDDGPIFRSSFYLSRIISADRTDTVYFTYVQDAAFVESDVSYTETVGAVCDGGKAYPHLPEDPFRHDYATSNSSRTIGVKRLSEIRYGTGKVVLKTKSDRLDASQSRLDSLIVFSREANGTYLRRNSFVFQNNSQFVSSSGSGQFKYRMKLTAIDEFDNLKARVKSHKFEYNETVLLPHRTSGAQDWWGLYNGQLANTSLIPYERIEFASTPFEIGGGNREPDSTYMKACMLKRIVYPTGGATEFYFEPHFYTGNKTVKEERAANAGQYGNTSQLFETIVVFTPTATGWAKVKTTCSNVTDGDPYFSRVIVKRYNNSETLLNHIYDPYNYPGFPPELVKDFWVYLTAGVSYELKVSSKGNSGSTLYGGAAFSQATIEWYQAVVGVKRMAGGLRVKKTIDYPGNGSPPITRVYQYGTTGDGTGTLLVPPESISSHKQENNIELWQVMPPANVPGMACATTRLLITSRPQRDLGGLNGSVVLYPKVTVYESSENGPNGQAEHFFRIEADQFLGVHKAYNDGLFQLNNSWRYGDEDSVIYYRGNTNERVWQTKNVFSVLQQNDAGGTKVGSKKSYQNIEVHIEPYVPSDYFYYFDYPVYTGVKKLISTETIQYASDNPGIISKNKVLYEYANLSPKHQQITRQTNYASDADTVIIKYWYPVDYNNTTDTIATLLDKNIIAQPLKVEVHSNSKIVAGKVNIVNKNGSPVDVYSFETTDPVTPPAHNTNLNSIPAGYKKNLSLEYNQASGNIVKINPRDGLVKTYLWGHDNSHPIAEITNAAPTQVFHTSFEDNTGVSGDAKTGKKYYNAGSYTIPVASRPSGTDLVMTFWYFNGTWKFQSEIPYNSTVSMSGANRLDEIRVYPRAAQMTTYTYEAGMGITSVTDPNNQTVYYEYDPFGRMVMIKDQNKHVIKNLQYHYKGQN
jgi:YD repeat-containing protein